MTIADRNFIIILSSSSVSEKMDHSKVSGKDRVMGWPLNA